MESQSLLLSEHIYSSVSQNNCVCSPDIYRDKPCEVQRPDPDSLKSRFKRLFTFHQAECEGLPLVCRGRLDK